MQLLNGFKKVFFCTWMLCALFSVNVNAARTELVIIKDGNVRSGPGTEYEVISKVALGDNFWLQEEGDSWYRIDLEKKEGWVSSIIAVSDGDSAYTNKLLILKSQSMKDGKKRVGYVKRGDIVTLVKKGSLQHIIEVNGVKGFVMAGETEQIGPSTFEAGTLDKILGQQGWIIDLFYKLDTLGKDNLILWFLKWAIAIGILFIPFFFMSKLVNVLAGVYFLKDKYILFICWIIVLLPAMNIFMFMFATPPYKGILFPVLFMIFWFSQIAYQKEKLHQNRCTKCRIMWATESKGTVFIGKFIGRSTTTYYETVGNRTRLTDIRSWINTWLEYKDVFECKFCGHRWYMSWSKKIGSKEVNPWSNSEKRIIRKDSHRL